LPEKCWWSITGSVLPFLLAGFEVSLVGRFSGVPRGHVRGSVGAGRHFLFLFAYDCNHGSTADATAQTAAGFTARCGLRLRWKRGLRIGCGRWRNYWRESASIPDFHGQAADRCFANPPERGQSVNPARRTTHSRKETGPVLLAKPGPRAPPN
jgi:hypothetical protein